MIYRGVKMKDDTTDKKKSRLDILKAIGIAFGAVLVIVSLILVIRELGVR